MAILGKPQGTFDLNDSNNCIGSFLKKNDVKEILEVTDNDLKEVNFILKDGIEVIDEREIQKFWYNSKIPNAKPSRVGNTKISLDELFLIAIIKRTYPTATIEHQVCWGRKRLDIRITYNEVAKIIEFHGPGHFANIGYGFPENPFDRKEQIEKEFKVECIIWPYWIQICSLNVKAIFETNIKGLGALWSTEIHFGVFHFEQSAQIIDKITNRFNAIDKEGYGYFYGGQTRNTNNPEHPIIEQIKNGKQDIGKIVPKGHIDKRYWIPNKLI